MLYKKTEKKDFNSMKIKKIILRTIIGLLILFVSVFNSSCKKHCEECKKINPPTFELIDTQTACDDEIEHLESRCYSCN